MQRHASKANLLLVVLSHMANTGYEQWDPALMVNEARLRNDIISRSIK
jgi:hypothetical protein